MRQIFIGFLLIFLNFNLTLNSSIINLIPDFLGYYFLLQGLSNLEENEYFIKAKGIVKVLLVYTSITFLADLLGVTLSLINGNSYFVHLIGVINIIASLYCSYLIVKGILLIAPSFDAIYEAEYLFTLWRILAIVQVVTYSFMFILPAISFLAMIVALVVNIVFLVQLYKLKEKYEKV